MEMADNSHNHNVVGLGVKVDLDHNEYWDGNYGALLQPHSPRLSHNSDIEPLRIKLPPKQFGSRSSPRMTPSPTRLTTSPMRTFDSIMSTDANNATTSTTTFARSLYSSPNTPHRSLSEQQSRSSHDSSHARISNPTRPSEASRLRALGSHLSSSSVQPFNGQQQQQQHLTDAPQQHSTTTENFSRPRRKDTVTSAASSPGSSKYDESPKPVLLQSNTFPITLSQSQAASEIPIITRDRGVSASSSIESSYIAQPLRPSQSIPDYSMADSVHSNQRNLYVDTHLSSYRRMSPKKNYPQERPPRTIPEADAEGRTSLKSSLTAASSFGYSTEAERSSMGTDRSSKTSIYGQEGMSVDDALDMYANGFQDSGQSEDEHHPQSSPPRSHGPADTKYEAPSSASPDPDQVMFSLPDTLRLHSPNTIVRDSHAFFTVAMPRGSLDGRDLEDRGLARKVSPIPFKGLEASAMPYSSQGMNGKATLSPASLSNAKQPAIQQPVQDFAKVRVSRDAYGFKTESQYVSQAQYDSWHRGYKDHLDRRTKKWHLMMREAGLPTTNPVIFPPRSSKVKRFVRKGIPPDWRGAAWFHYGGGATMLGKHPGRYDELLRRSQTSELKAECNEQIERDLHRTFPDNIRFKPETVATPSRTSDVEKQSIAPVETPILHSLRRVLRAFSIHSKKIGYCQSLNFIAGLLLLFIPDEEKAFWMLVVVTHVYLPGTHEVSLEGANVDLGVIMSLTKDTMPSIWAKIAGELDGSESEKDQNSMRLPPITLCLTSWFMSCYIGSLPIETTLRVWDTVFYEGSKTIFRIALAIFKQGENEIRKVTDPMEIFQVVQGIPRKMIDANALIEACFQKRSGFSNISQETIEKKRRERKDAYADERAKARGEVLVRKGTLFGRRRLKSHRHAAGNPIVKQIHDKEV